MYLFITIVDPVENRTKTIGVYHLNDTLLFILVRVSRSLVLLFSFYYDVLLKLVLFFVFRVHEVYSFVLIYSLHFSIFLWILHSYEVLSACHIFFVKSLFLS